MECGVANLILDTSDSVVDEHVVEDNVLSALAYFVHEFLHQLRLIQHHHLHRQYPFVAENLVSDKRE